VHDRAVPILDDAVHQRLTKRFGAEIGPWLDELPDVLGALAERWQVEWGSLIPRGNLKDLASVIELLRAPHGHSEDTEKAYDGVMACVSTRDQWAALLD
jgi:hypothetical protein